jgi:O-antigen ligase/Tfp pilus assembly protein PilF
MAWLDRIVLAGLIVLLVFSPLAIGAVNPWAYGAAEALIFILTAVWMLRSAAGDDRLPKQIAALALPAGLCVGLILFQLVPLPPGAESWLSPSTYRLYETCLPGWPRHQPYSEMVQSPLETPSQPHRTGVFTVENGLQPAGHPQADGRGLAGGGFSSWRPLSIAPSLTAAALIKALSYICLFFLVVLYPLRRYPRPGGEARFCRRLLGAVMITAMVVACLGLLEMAFWNGAILWLYVPYDWGQPMPGLNDRATGPFVNADHFAAYLNLALPLILAGGLLDTFLSRRWQEWFRILCFGAASILICAIALSLSRGGLIAGTIGASLVIWSALKQRWRAPDSALRRKIAGTLYVAALLGVVGAAAFYTSPDAPSAVSARLDATVREPDLGTRLGYWRDTQAMIRDYPVFGVGLGAFEDLFPRYQSPPWTAGSVRQAHNDYLEVAAEIGLAGLGLIAWFGVAAAILIVRGLRSAPSEIAAIVGALMAGLAAIAFQEFFDFALQIPANAILFTILLGLAVRLSGVNRSGSVERQPSVLPRWCAASMALASIALVFAALSQDKTPYPYLRVLPHTPHEAQALILAHPARSTAHLWYAMLEHRSTPIQLRELATAVSLEPNNPWFLDSYAHALAASGQTKAGLEELTRSVFVDPSMADHFYLKPESIPWLSVDERKAIDAGFRQAMDHHFEGAGSSYAAYCAAVSHHAQAADVLAQASASAGRPDRRVQLLLEAGSAYAQSNEMARARSAFEQAARIMPANPAPYEYLVTEIFAPRKDIDAAKAAVEQGIRNGADPSALYIALARAYEQAGDLAGAEQALLKAAWMRPNGRSDYDSLMRMADLERRRNHPEQAEMWMRRAIEMRPDSPEALYQLALIEEADYEYGQALLDLSKALKLAPGNEAMKSHYQDLLRMIAAHSNHKSNGQAGAGP